MTSEPNASDIANAERAAKALNIVRADECAIHSAMYARLEAEERVEVEEALAAADAELTYHGYREKSPARFAIHKVLATLRQAQSKPTDDDIRQAFEAGLLMGLRWANAGAPVEQVEDAASKYVAVFRSAKRAAGTADPNDQAKQEGRSASVT